MSFFVSPEHLEKCSYEVLTHHHRYRFHVTIAVLVTNDFWFIHYAIFILFLGVIQREGR